MINKIKLAVKWSDTYLCQYFIYTSDIFVIDQAAIRSMADCGNKLLKQETQTQYWAIMYKLGLHSVWAISLLCAVPMYPLAALEEI